MKIKKCAQDGCEKRIESKANTHYCYLHKGLDKWARKRETARLKRLQKMKGEGDDINI